MFVQRRVTRRGFLRGAAAAVGAPYVLTSAALGRGPFPAASERVTLACIGVKNQGGGHLRSLLRWPEVRVLAICDADEEILDKGMAGAAGAYGDGAKGTKRYVDFREVMARGDIDGVVIATPDHSHAHIAVAAMRSGKDAFVEKPMTLTIREGRAMAEAAQRYGRVVQVGSQRRSSAAIAHGVELVRNGRIGKLHTVYVNVSCSRPGGARPWEVQPVPKGFHYDLWLGPAPWAPFDPGRCHYNFRFVRAYSGGEMTNWGAHFFDVAQWGLGMDDSGPVEVEPTAGFRYDSGIYDVFKSFKLIYTYANGVKMYCNYQGAGGGIKWVGDEGWIDAAGGASSPMLTWSRIGPEEIRVRRGVGGHMGDFVHCIRTREQPTAPVEAGHRSATVCHLGNIALELGRKVRWDPVKEEFPGDEEANRLTWRPYRQPWSL